MDRDEATSPSTAITPSREMSFLTTVAGSPALDWSSSWISSIFLPSTPPAALTSWMANSVPWCDICPNVASFPVNEANSPTLIVPPPPLSVCLLQLQQITITPQTVSKFTHIRARESFISVILLPLKPAVRVAVVEAVGREAKELSSEFQSTSASHGPLVIV